jgi:glycosyltransferase involved in cell wall biosynthesis
MPTVSVIMNCWNSEKYLKEALDSLASQTYKDFEVIFWDNNSSNSDSSVEIARGYPFVRVFQDKVTRPLGESRNLAIDKATGEYIAFLDCDDLWLPEKLEKQMKLMKWNSRCNRGLVYSNCHHIDKDGNIVGSSFKPGTSKSGFIFDELFRRNFIPLVTVIVSKNILPKFNPKYFIAEEYDVWLKIADRYPVYCIDEVLAKYRVYPTQYSKKMKWKLVEERREIASYWVRRERSLLPMALRVMTEVYFGLAVSYIKGGLNAKRI